MGSYSSTRLAFMRLGANFNHRKPSSTVLSMPYLHSFQYAKIVYSPLARLNWTFRWILLNTCMRRFISAYSSVTNSISSTWLSYRAQYKICGCDWLCSSLDMMIRTNSSAQNDPNSGQTPSHPEFKRTLSTTVTPTPNSFPPHLSHIILNTKSDNE